MKDVRPGLHEDKQVLSCKVCSFYKPYKQRLMRSLCNMSRLQRRYPLGITTGHLGEDTGGVTDDPDFALDEEDVEDNFSDVALEDWLTL